MEMVRLVRMVVLDAAAVDVQPKVLVKKPGVGEVPHDANDEAVCVKMPTKMDEEQPKILTKHESVTPKQLPKVM